LQFPPAQQIGVVATAAALALLRLGAHRAVLGALSQRHYGQVSLDARCPPHRLDSPCNLLCPRCSRLYPRRSFHRGVCHHRRLCGVCRYGQYNCRQRLCRSRRAECDGDALELFPQHWIDPGVLRWVCHRERLWLV
ncbi:unnamed protein product, partial [Aphanomyces euteiches]